MGDAIEQRGRWFVLAAAVLWGTTGTAQAFAPAGAPPLAVGALRLLIGGAALLLIAMTRGGFPRSARWPLWSTLFAAGSMAMYQVCFFAAVLRTGVAVGTVVTIGSAPPIGGILAALVNKERITARWMAATSFAVAGCALLVLRGSDLSVDLTGIFLALGAGTSYAVYALASKQLLRQHPPEMAMAVVFCLGGLMLAPLLIGADLRWAAAGSGLATVLHLGLVATALAYTLFARGLKAIPVATAVTLSLAEPLTAGLLGLFLLGERLTPAAGAGIGLLLTGLAVLALDRTPVERRSSYEQI